MCTTHVLQFLWRPEEDLRGRQISRIQASQSCYKVAANLIKSTVRKKHYPPP
ncbi:mCG148201 [Mus musculus]|nr:mCG148201 [Mus musculus]